MSEKLFLLLVFLLGTLFFFISPLVNKPIFACTNDDKCTDRELESCHCGGVDMPGGTYIWCRKVENNPECPSGRKQYYWSGLDCDDCGDGTSVASKAQINGYITLNGGGRVGQSATVDGGRCSGSASCDPSGPECGLDTGSCGISGLCNGYGCNPVISGVDIAATDYVPLWWCPSHLIMQGQCNCGDTWWFCKDPIDTSGINFTFFGMTINETRGFNVTGVPAGYICNYTFTVNGTPTSGTGCSFTSPSLPAGTHSLVVDLVAAAPTATPTNTPVPTPTATPTNTPTPTPTLGPVGAWVDTGRDFKVWDCKVTVSGAVFDGSVGPMCPNIGFDISAESNMNFISLGYTGFGTSDQNMTVSRPSSYSGNGNKLIWNDDYSYLPVFNSDLEGTSPKIRITDRGDGGLVRFCPSLGTVTLDNSSVSPYTSDPTVEIDFSFIRNQDPWFQVQKSGIMANRNIVDNVPVTCAGAANGCIPVMTIYATDIFGSGDNGLVAAKGSILNQSGCESSDLCFFGDPNNWGLEGQSVVNEAVTYTSLYNDYFVKFGEGKAVGTGTSLSTQIGTGNTGVYFINGDLTIDTDNTVPNGQYLMMVVSGNINILPSVNSIDGIFVTGGNINVGGTSVTKLVMSGVYYSIADSINLSRSYTSKTDNNDKPAVEVRYRPDMIFSLPGKLNKALSGWAER